MAQKREHVCRGTGATSDLLPFMYVLHCGFWMCFFLHADCMLAAGPLQIKPGLLRGWGLGGWWADIAFL